MIKLLVFFQRRKIGISPGRKKKISKYLDRIYESDLYAIWDLISDYENNNHNHWFPDKIIELLAKAYDLAITIKNEQPYNSEAFINFYYHVFGYYAYYLYNGLGGYIFSALEDDEIKEAKRLVIQAFTNNIEEERKIEAAGYLKIKELAPRLKKILKSDKRKNDIKFRSLVNSALHRINFENVDRDNLLEILLGEKKSTNLTMEDAARLLIGFGKDQKVIKALLKIFIDTQSDSRLAILNTAFSPLLCIFKEDKEIFDALWNYVRSSRKNERANFEKVVSLINDEMVA